MQLCLENGFFDIAKEIIKHGGEIDNKNDKGMTPLIYFAFRGNENAVDFLIENKASLDICNLDGWNAIVGAYANNQTSIVSKLMEAGASFPEKFAQAALFNSYTSGNRNLALSLLEKGVNPNFTDKNNEPLIIYAVKQGDFDFVNELLKYGANPNTRSKSGSPLIHFLAKNNQTDLIEEVLTKGGDINLFDLDGFNALCVAVTNNQKQSVKLLYDNGIFLNQNTIKNGTALHLAVRKKLHGIAEFLIKKGINTELVDSIGMRADYYLNTSLNKYDRPKDGDDYQLFKLIKESRSDSIEENQS